MADRHAYSFQLANVPAPDETQLYQVTWDAPFYTAYEDIHQEVAGSALEGVRAFVAPGGRLTLEVPHDAEVSGEELLAFARQQVERTDERFRALVKARVDRGDVEHELAKPYQSVIGPVGVEGVEITEIRAQLAAEEPRDGPTEDQVIVTLTVPRDMRPIDLENVMRLELDVRPAHGTGREIWFPREELEPAEIRRLVKEAAAIVRERLAHERHKTNAHDEAQQRTLRGLRAALQR